MSGLMAQWKWDARGLLATMVFVGVEGMQSSGKMNKWWAREGSRRGGEGSTAGGRGTRIFGKTAQWIVIQNLLESFSQSKIKGPSFTKLKEERPLSPEIIRRGGPGHVHQSTFSRPSPSPDLNKWSDVAQVISVRGQPHFEGNYPPVIRHLL